MVSKTFTAAVFAVAAPALVAGQTWTTCSPLVNTCPPNPAFGNEVVHCDFTAGACASFNSMGSPLQYGANGAVFPISGLGQAPTIGTGKYIFFGRVDVEVQAAPGVGIVTSAVLQSDDLDEIDWEWLGGDNAQVQTNYFSKGDVSTYDRGAFHPVVNPTGQFHVYSLEWTSKAVVWSIDGVPVRTLTYEQAKGGTGFPQSPMQIKLGTWVAGRPDAAPGTVTWAGGMADFSKGPFNGYYKSIAITDYAGSDAPCTKSVTQYVYGDRSGSWQSIRVA